MKLKDKIRKLVFLLLNARDIDRLRYLKFNYKFSKFSKYKDRNSFIKGFSNFYEPEMVLIPKILHNPEVIVDVGANYGPYSFFLSKIYPNSKIFAFEPSTRTFNIFKKIVKKFNLQNVIPIKKGLGSIEEKKEIFMPSYYTILAYVSYKNSNKNKEDLTEEIDVTTLDSFVKRNGLKKLDFIKCDVEGFELQVFKGAKKTLKKLKPIVFVEIEERHTKKYGTNPQDVLKLFKGLGYLCYSVKKDKISKTERVSKEIPLYLLAHKKQKF